MWKYNNEEISDINEIPYGSFGFVYEVIHLPSGKRYVGSTMNYSSRISKHKSLLRKNKHHSFLLQRAWNK